MKHVEKVERKRDWKENVKVKVNKKEIQKMRYENE